MDGYDVLCRVGMMHFVLGEVCGMCICTKCGMRVIPVFFLVEMTSLERDGYRERGSWNYV